MAGGLAALEMDASATWAVRSLYSTTTVSLLTLVVFAKCPRAYMPAWASGLSLASTVLYEMHIPDGHFLM